VNNKRRAEVIERVRRACAEGRQAYWVCPLIEESEKLELQTAVALHAELTAALPEFAVGLLHGRMKPDDKAAVMAEFVAGRVHVLVATTVIEVGVDVPNASLMAIEHAERFGWRSCTSLRGRVGRGAAESTCYCCSRSRSPTPRRRGSRSIFEHTDGSRSRARISSSAVPASFSGEAIRRAAAALRRSRTGRRAHREGSRCGQDLLDREPASAARTSSGGWAGARSSSRPSQRRTHRCLITCA
jgi:ATP-dependent DNA helicase RecG